MYFTLCVYLPAIGHVYTSLDYIKDPLSLEKLEASVSYGTLEAIRKTQWAAPKYKNGSQVLRNIQYDETVSNENLMIFMGWNEILMVCARSPRQVFGKREIRLNGNIV